MHQTYKKLKDSCRPRNEGKRRHAFHTNAGILFPLSFQEVTLCGSGRKACRAPFPGGHAVEKGGMWGLRYLAISWPLAVAGHRELQAGARQLLQSLSRAQGCLQPQPCSAFPLHCQEQDQQHEQLPWAKWATPKNAAYKHIYSSWGDIHAP